MSKPILVPELKNYTRDELQRMSVASLKKLIQKHNLHTTYIKGYSRMRKDVLVTEFLKHHKKSEKRRLVPVKVNSPKKQMTGLTKGQSTTADMLQDLETRVRARVGPYKDDGNLREDRI